MIQSSSKYHDNGLNAETLSRMRSHEISRTKYDNERVTCAKQKTIFTSTSISDKMLSTSNSEEHSKSILLVSKKSVSKDATSDEDIETEHFI